mmetsp:Transcript_42085/g.95092  ORF Transcript_42085/g.95092 Transcript_42085/m.95092 type:complete len:215 (-) Transcript_42085:1498-2142(-)
MVISSVPRVEVNVVDLFAREDNVPWRHVLVQRQPHEEAPRPLPLRRHQPGPQGGDERNGFQGAVRDHVARPVSPHFDRGEPPPAQVHPGGQRKAGAGLPGLKFVGPLGRKEPRAFEWAEGARLPPELDEPNGALGISFGEAANRKAQAALRTPGQPHYRAGLLAIGASVAGISLDPHGVRALVPVFGVVKMVVDVPRHVDHVSPHQKRKTVAHF